MDHPYAKSRESEKRSTLCRTKSRFARAVERSSLRSDKAKYVLSLMRAETTVLKQEFDRVRQTCQPNDVEALLERIVREQKKVTGRLERLLDEVESQLDEMSDREAKEFAELKQTIVELSSRIVRFHWVKLRDVLEEPETGSRVN